MAHKRRTADDIFDSMTGRRAVNNNAWMRLAKLAYKASPKEAKVIIREILSHDKAITGFWVELLDAPDDTN